MLSRCLALMWIPALIVLPFILPFGPEHTVDAVIAGGLATALAFFSLIDDRARIWTAVLGAWVALAPFVIWSTLVERVVCVSWGVLTFAMMVGPFSEAPAVTRIAGVVPIAPTTRDDRHDIPLAA